MPWRALPELSATLAELQTPILGVAARQGHGKAWRGHKVQRGQNFKFDFMTLLNF